MNDHIVKKDLFNWQNQYIRAPKSKSKNKKIIQGRTQSSSRFAERIIQERQRSVSMPASRLRKKD